MDKIILSFLKDLLLEMIVSFVLIVAVAFIVLKISPAYSTIQILILATYVIATFAGGYVKREVYVGSHIRSHICCCHSFSFDNSERSN